MFIDVAPFLRCVTLWKEIWMLIVVVNEQRDKQYLKEEKKTTHKLTNKIFFSSGDWNMESRILKAESTWDRWISN